MRYAREHRNEADGEHKPHLVKTIGKTTCLVTCHFSETSKETLQDTKRGRSILVVVNGEWTWYNEF